MDILHLAGIAIWAAFLNNPVFTRYLGLCPLAGVTEKWNNAVVMGLAVTFVMTMAAFFTWILYSYLLVPLKIDYLRTLVFVLVVAAVVQMAEMFFQKNAPDLFKSLGIYLPLMATNCAVLGLLFANISEKLDLLESLFHAMGSGAGFLIALLLMAGVRERLAFAKVPKAMEGMPVVLLAAGLISLAFFGLAKI